MFIMYYLKCSMDINNVHRVFYFGFGYSMSIQLFTMFLNFVQYILHNVQCVFANCSTYFYKIFSTCPKNWCMVNNIEIRCTPFECTLNKISIHDEHFLYTLNIFQSSSNLTIVHQFWKMFINFERKFINMK